MEWSNSALKFELQSTRVYPAMDSDRPLNFCGFGSLKNILEQYNAAEGRTRQNEIESMSARLSALLTVAWVGTPAVRTSSTFASNTAFGH